MELNQNEVSVPQPIIEINQRGYSVPQLILQIGLRGYLENNFFYFAHQNTYWVASIEVHHFGRKRNFF